MDRARYRRIVLFFARHILSIICWDVLFPRLGLRKTSQRTRPARMQRMARQFRLLAIRMGGVMIKAGQFLSTRVDVMPPEFTDELINLQDEVPAESYLAIRKVAEAEYGAPLSEMFAWFDEIPLAAASLGQVHRARVAVKVLVPAPAAAPSNAIAQPPAIRTTQSPALPPPTPPSMQTVLREVVVKVQRPNIEEIIATDMAALRTVGRWLNKYKPIRRRANVPGLMDEFSRILYEEIDYLAEGRNAESFAANFADSPGIRVPSVVWTHTTRRSLTLENVWGIKITDYERISAAGIPRAAVANRLIDTYFQQIFEDGFFHADPHPGNLFVNPDPVYSAAQLQAFAEGRLVEPKPAPPKNNSPAAASAPTGNGEAPSKSGSVAPSTANPPKQIVWQLTFVDFGMVGHVPENTRQGLREILIGVGTKDTKRVIRAYQMMGVLLPGADLEELERFGATMFDRFWGRNMSELTQISTEEIREFTHEFRELLYKLPFQVPQDLIFLARTVGILSGIATGLDPTFNIFDHIAPYAKKLISDEIRTERGSWVAEAGVYLQNLVNLPGRVDRMISRLEAGEMATRNPELSRQVRGVERAVRQLAGGITFAALLLSGVLLYINGDYWLAAILGIGALAGMGYSLTHRG